MRADGCRNCRHRPTFGAVTGRLHIVQDDGTELETEPGTAYVIDPGHDAWVLGDAEWVAYEFESKTAETYAAGS
jgi:uncharacterized cupin superfamily protein